MRSPIYWHRLIYLNTYGRSHPDFKQRFEAVAGMIPAGSSVLDICCGDAELYTDYLRPRKVGYTGIDISLSMAPRRVRPLLIQANARETDFPTADYVVMIESLYHFHPRTLEILERMRRAAREKVIVIEQVQNKIARLPLWLVRLISDPGDGSGWFRFDRETLERIVDQVDGGARKQPICGGYDLLVVMKGGARP